MEIMMRALMVLPLMAALVARPPDEPTKPASSFLKTEVMIPMRDGVRLHTEIYTPKHATLPLPFLITRTPYGINSDDQGFAKPLGEAGYKELIDEGFILVFQDVRGRYKSEGKFVMMRPLVRHNAQPGGIDESTDAYDTIDWLVKN